MIPTLLSLSSIVEASTIRTFTLVVHAQEIETIHQDTGEAISRLGILVNGTYPGPTLMVNKGDQVRVQVVNQLADRETVLHFHGQHQVDTFYMDGVGGVTQVSFPVVRRILLVCGWSEPGPSLTTTRIIFYCSLV